MDLDDMKTRQALPLWPVVAVISLATACGGRTSLARWGQGGHPGSGGTVGDLGGQGGVGGNQRIPPDDSGALPPTRADGGEAPSPSAGTARANTVWTHPGRPYFDQAGNLYTIGGGYMRTPKSLCMVDKTTGTDLWSLSFMGDVCHAEGMVINFDGTNDTISALAQKDGSLRWAQGSKKVRGFSCMEQSHVFFTIEEGETQDWALNAYEARDGSRAWQKDLATTVTFEHFAGETLYVSWVAGDRSNLQALGALDGAERWQTGFAATPVRFQFDAQENIFALDDTEQSLTRVGTLDGTRVWTYQSATTAAAAGVAVVLGNSIDLLAVASNERVVALDKASGNIRWTYDATLVARDAAWQADFAESGDLLLFGRDDAGSTSTIIDRDGRTLWAIPGQVSELGSGEFYRLVDRVVSRLDRNTGNALWTFKDDGTAGDIYTVLGSHGDQVFLLGAPTATGPWGAPDKFPVLAIDRADGHLLWISAQLVSGSILLADDEHIYLWGGPAAKYDTYGLTTAIRVEALM